MIVRAIGSLAAFLFSFLFLCSLAHAKCATDVVVVNGRIEHAPDKAKVHVQLVYPHHRGGESAETTLESSEFTIRVHFFTQSRGPVLFGEWLERCNREPKTAVVSLIGNDPPQVYDSVILKLHTDFKETDSGYALKSEVMLNGAR